MILLSFIITLLVISSGERVKTKPLLKTSSRIRFTWLRQENKFSSFISLPTKLTIEFCTAKIIFFKKISFSSLSATTTIANSGKAFDITEYSFKVKFCTSIFCHIFSLRKTNNSYCKWWNSFLFLWKCLEKLLSITLPLDSTK